MRSINIPTGITKEDLLRLYAEKYPEAGENTRASWASQMLRFVTKLKTGDDVVTWDRERRRYVLGKIASKYEWAPKLIAEVPHVRRVNWTGTVARDRLAPPTRNSLGSVLTLFEIPPDAAKDTCRSHFCETSCHEFLAEELLRSRQIPCNWDPAEALDIGRQIHLVRCLN